MGKRKVGALEKIDADLYVAFLLHRPRRHDEDGFANIQQRESAVQDPERPKASKRHCNSLAEEKACGHTLTQLQIIRRRVPAPV